MPSKRKKFISLSEHEALTDAPSQTRAVSNPLALRNAYPIEIRPRRTASEAVWNSSTETSHSLQPAEESQKPRENQDVNSPAQQSSDTHPPSVVSNSNPPFNEAAPAPASQTSSPVNEVEDPEQETPAYFQSRKVSGLSLFTNIQPHHPLIDQARVPGGPSGGVLLPPEIAGSQFRTPSPLSDNDTDIDTPAALLPPPDRPPPVRLRPLDKQYVEVVGGPVFNIHDPRSANLSSKLAPVAVDRDLRYSGTGSILSSPFQGSDDMATASFRTSGDGRRPNRYENRAPSSTVLCRNGPQCRKFQEGTCNYNHDFGNSMSPNGLKELAKKSLNVESPAFTPKTGNAQLAKMAISPKAATAATFTPRGSGTVTPAMNTNSHSKDLSGDFSPGAVFQPAAQGFTEFFPANSFVNPQQSMEQQASQQTQMGAFGDHFPQQSIIGLDQSSINPYVQQTGHAAGQPFFQDSSAFRPPANYHLYSSIGPRRENMLPYQRSTTDFFISDELREELQRKSEAALQIFANSTLPQIDRAFHSLVALDTNNSRGQSTFGYPSWIYKATSQIDGHIYALRRIAGFRLNDAAAVIRTAESWKRITNASLVQVYDAFTTRAFEDGSLIVRTAYHPCSQTLAEKHFGTGRLGSRQGNQITPEAELWGYIVQLGSVLMTIHEAGLAAQTLIASKVLLTSKNRVRLNGCAVFDILNYGQQKPIDDLQQADMVDLGRLILSIAARNVNAPQNVVKSLETVSRSYSERLRSAIAWLLAPPPKSPDASQQSEATASQYNINSFLANISDKVVGVMDSTLHHDDELTSELQGELENGRLVRLMAKLNVILERPDLSSSLTGGTNPAIANNPSSAWSEIGDRFYLKLFRDFVFHQVDADGRPVINLGHIISCLNKLDAGIDENIQLITRDEQNMMIVSYKEIKRCFEAAWSEILKASNSARR